MSDVAALPVNTGVATLTPAVADAGATTTAVEDTPIDHGDTGGDAGDDAGDTQDTGDQDQDADANADADAADGDTDVADDTAGDDLSIKAINDKFKELAATEFGKQNAAWLKQLRH